MKRISDARHRFPADVIRPAVWLYYRFTLSFRDVEAFLAQRGVEVSYETIRRRKAVVAQQPTPDGPTPPVAGSVACVYGDGR